MDKKWFVYILECVDGTYYTGITTNLERRVKAHNDKKGAKYTSQRLPAILCYSKKDIHKVKQEKKKLS